MEKSFEKQVKDCMDELLRRKRVLEDCQYALEKAKKSYDDYNKKVVSELMHTYGIDQLRLTSGITAEVKTKTYVSVNRSKIDQVADWLVDNGGAHLLKEDCTVAPEYEDKLKGMDIPYQLNKNVNTTSLKAFLLDQMGQKGGYAYLNPDKLPDGISFYQEDVVEFKEKT